MFTRYNTVDQADAKEAMNKLEELFGRDDSSAAMVLQEEKRGQEESPNLLKSLTPLVGVEPTT